MNRNLSAWDWIKKHRTAFSAEANIIDLAEDLDSLLNIARSAAAQEERDAMARTLLRVERCVMRVFEWGRRNRDAH